MTTYSIKRQRYGDPYFVIETRDGKREVVAKFRTWREAQEECEELKKFKAKVWRD